MGNQDGGGRYTPLCSLLTLHPKPYMYMYIYICVYLYMLILAPPLMEGLGLISWSFGAPEFMTSRFWVRFLADLLLQIVVQTLATIA